MNAQTLLMLPYAALAVLLIWVAIGDFRARIIPNWLNATIALLGVSTWFLSGMPLWPGVAMQVALAAGILLVFAFLFAKGMMGGGDVKLLVALALWFPAMEMMRLLVIMSLCGGALTLAYLLHHKLRKILDRPEIPYGVAIALAGLWVIYERNLNQFV